MATARNNILLRPQWVISNQLTLPLVTINDNNKKSVRGLVSVIIPFTIFLDTLFADKTSTVSTGRSMDRDQFQIYKSVEGALQTTGVNGKACLLRTICELQQRKEISEYSLVGELVSLLLTPRKGFFSDLLHEYVEAEHIGRSNNSSSCIEAFPLCPVSIFNLFEMYNSPAESNSGKLWQSSEQQTVVEDNHQNLMASDLSQLSLEQPSIDENVV